MVLLIPLVVAICFEVLHSIVHYDAVHLNSWDESCC